MIKQIPWRAAVVVLAGLSSVVCSPAAARADVRLPTIFSSHLLLQRDVENPLWGTADPDEKLSVKLDDKVIAVQAGADGRWTAKLPATPAGGPHKIVIEDSTGDNKITLGDVLFGELWVCSGQSNMEMGLISTDKAAEDVAAADHPQIRLFTIPNTRADQPQDDCQGRWAACTPKTAAGFSATAYYFGADLQKALGVPIGLITPRGAARRPKAGRPAQCSMRSPRSSTWPAADRSSTTA